MVFPALESLAGRRILVSNDDGIHAEGLAVLEGIARQLSDDVWVVAPETEQSGASHSLTMHRPLRVRRLGDKRFTLDGTPTDCVLLASGTIMKDRKPDIVLSGVNHGHNLADDVTYSGTIAAAMEGTLLGIRSFALSQHYDFAGDGGPDFAAAAAYGADVVAKACRMEWPATMLCNINFPACKPDAVSGVTVAPHGKRKIGDELLERIDPRGRPYVWIGSARSTHQQGDTSTDYDIIMEGGIAVTPLQMDLTHHEMLAPLEAAFLE